MNTALALLGAGIACAVFVFAITWIFDTPINSSGITTREWWACRPTADDPDRYEIFMREPAMYKQAYIDAIDATRDSGADWNIVFVMALAARGIRLTEPGEVTQKSSRYPGRYPMQAPWPAPDYPGGWDKGSFMVWAL